MDQDSRFAPVAQTAFAPTKKDSLLADILQSFVIAAFIWIILSLFIATPNQVQGESMEPNFHDGQVLLTNKISQWLGQTQLGQQLDLDYKRGDVVVLHKPGEIKPFIKRIVGMPGDKIRIEDGNVLIDGNIITENYIPAELRTSAGTFLQEGEEKSIPNNHYFVMGDNRADSKDSRTVEVGFVNRDWIQGKVILRYWPPQTFGIIGTGDYRIAE